MPPRSLVTQQSLSPGKFERAKEMRREMTPAERKLWSHLRAGRLDGFHFRRQQIIEPYIADFYCHQVGLVIEADGDVHLDQQEYDHQRDEHLQTQGLRVLRFTNCEIMQNLDTVLEKIYLACRQATLDNQASDCS
jgi:very-short-patch-repair endonuclease